MDRKLRSCAVCMKKYKFCINSRQDKDKPYWLFTFCSENCKKIYDVTSRFENSMIDPHEAAEYLRELDLRQLDNFRQPYKKSIDKIFNSVSKTSKTIKNMVGEDEPIVETPKKTSTNRRIKTKNEKDTETEND